MQYAAPVAPAWLEVGDSQKVTVQRVQPGASMVFVAVSAATPTNAGANNPEVAP